jgi:hypothetical protein
VAQLMPRAFGLGTVWFGSATSGSLLSHVGSDATGDGVVGLLVGGGSNGHTTVTTRAAQSDRNFGRASQQFVSERLRRDGRWRPGSLASGSGSDDRHGGHGRHGPPQPGLPKRRSDSAMWRRSAAYRESWSGCYARDSRWHPHGAAAPARTPGVGHNECRTGPADRGRCGKRQSRRVRRHEGDHDHATETVGACLGRTPPAAGTRMRTSCPRRGQRDQP